MKLSKRETSLIDLFIKHGKSITATELAHSANVSTKTIYRTIRRINEAANNKEIILSEIGKGFRLDYDQYLEETIESQENAKFHDPIERRNSIALIILFKSPKKILVKDLFQQYYLSEAVINSDVSRISEYYQEFDLHICRSRNRVTVKGKEKNIRRCLNDLLSKAHIWNEEMFTQKYAINSFDINFITSILEYIETQLFTGIAYPYNMNIFSHIYILISRAREGEIANDDVEAALDSQEATLIKENQGLYEIAQTVIKKISHYLVTVLPESEIFYLFQYLFSSRIETKTIPNQNQSKDALSVTAFFIKNMEELMNIKMDYYANRNELLCHIQPMLYRLKNQILIKNGILKDIQSEYVEIYRYVCQVCKKAEEEFKINPISEDEIGFLSLYFIKFKVSARDMKRVLIMCSSGVGTSELLKVKVQRAFPTVEIVDVLSARQYRKNGHRYNNIDVILTTVNVPIESSSTTILVNSVFTKQDELRVKQLLGEM